MPKRVIDAWDYFYHKQKMKRNKKLKVVKRKMKIGDEVTVRVYGAGVFSDEDGHIIEEINDNGLKVEDIDQFFYKSKKGNYQTERSMFGFHYFIKGE